MPASTIANRTLAQFLVDIQIGLGDVAGRGLSSYTTRWLNTAYMTLTTKKRIPGIKRELYFPQLETFDDTQAWADTDYTLDVPADALIIRGIWDDTNDCYLKRFPSIREYWRKTDRQSEDNKGVPKQWIRHEDKIYTYPQADDDYSAIIYYKKIPLALESGVQDATEIGPEWDEAIYLLAMVQIHEKLGEFEYMAAKKKQFIEYVHDIIGIYDEEGKDAKRVFRPTESSIDYSYRK